MTILTLAESHGGREGTLPVPCWPGCCGLAVTGGWCRPGGCRGQRTVLLMSLLPPRGGPMVTQPVVSAVSLQFSWEAASPALRAGLWDQDLCWVSGGGQTWGYDPPVPQTDLCLGDCLLPASQPPAPLCTHSVGPLQDPLPAASWRRGHRPGQEGGAWRDVLEHAGVVVGVRGGAWGASRGVRVVSGAEGLLPLPASHTPAPAAAGCVSACVPVTPPLPFCSLEPACTNTRVPLGTCCLPTPSGNPVELTCI